MREIIRIVEAGARCGFGHGGGGAEGGLGGFEPETITVGAQAEAGFLLELSGEVVGVITGGARET